MILVSTEDADLHAAGAREWSGREPISSGFDRLVFRTAYVEYFGAAHPNCAERVPHERGKLWGEALLHVLAPRILVPSKRVIHDSDRTNAYSGVSVARGEDGTSISLGYMAESYIDFGPVGMFVPLFLVRSARRIGLPPPHAKRQVFPAPLGLRGCAVHPVRVDAWNSPT